MTFRQLISARAGFEIRRDPVGAGIGDAAVPPDKEKIRIGGPGGLLRAVVGFQRIEQTTH
jgi:hypothetical protein